MKAAFYERTGAAREVLRIGERVWLCNGQWERPCGTAAEHIALPAAQAVPLPEGSAFDAGASLGVPAMTALHAVDGVAVQVREAAGGRGPTR